MNLHKKLICGTTILIMTIGMRFTANAQTNVNFQTEDGWSIAGTLFLPKDLSAAPIPAVVLLTEPEWVDRSIYDGYLAKLLAKQGIAAMSIDLRGTGGSLGSKEYPVFSSQEREKIQLDVRAAVKFLGTQPNIDPKRIAVVGAGASADHATREAAVNSAIQSLVLISGNLSESSESFIKERSDIPVLCIAGKKDKEALREMSYACSLSGNDDTDVILAVGHGTVMFSHTKGLEEQVVAWLDTSLRKLGRELPVSFKTEDGWTLNGSIMMPDGVTKNAKLPAVVLVHGAKHDQQTYYNLQRVLAKKGMIALRFDRRGKGSSNSAPNGAKPVTSEPDDTQITADIKAAIRFMESQPNADNIGLVAATAACTNALQASIGDPRIKTQVLMTALDPNDEVKKYLATSDVPVFAIASLEDNNYQRGSLAGTTKLIYSLSNSKSSQLLMYDDAGRGSEMFKTKPELEGMVVRWLEEKLASGTTMPANRR